MTFWSDYYVFEKDNHFICLDILFRAQTAVFLRSSLLKTYRMHQKSENKDIAACSIAPSMILHLKSSTEYKNFKQEYIRINNHY